MKIFVAFFWILLGGVTIKVTESIDGSIIGGVLLLVGCLYAVYLLDKNT